MNIYDEFSNMLRASRDPINEHFDQVHVFIDQRSVRDPNRVIAIARRTKASSTVSRRGHSIWPPPVAVAEFAGGEKIRMSCWQRAGKPWDFIAARRMLAQTIGNERGVATTRAMKRRSKSKNAANKIIHSNGYPPASDFVAFYIEHDGKRYDEQTARVPSYRPKLKIRRAMEALATISISTQTKPRVLGELMIEMETHLGSDFLDTKAWRRVRSRVKALARIAA